MVFIYLLILLTVIVNFLFLYFDFFPFFKNIWKAKRKNISIDINKNFKTIEDDLIGASFRIIETDKILTTWDKKQYVTEKLYHYFKKTKSNSFKKFHFPVAFLYHGFASYLLHKGNEDDVSRFKRTFDKILDDHGNPKFTINKPDQIPFGLTSFSLYEKFQDQKYLNFSEHIYQFILENLNDKGIMPYNKFSDNHYVDVLGMTVPFLVHYYKATVKSETLNLAKKQIDFFEQHGIDNETLLPSHSFHLKSLVRTGSVNWGRGFGWYLLAINAVNAIDGSYQNKLEKICTTIPQIKNYLYSQFPGSSQKVDMSATTMLLNCFIESDIIKITKEEFITIFQPYLQDGYVMQTSGDTIGINDYSDFFGKSEFSQGMFLLILSKLK